ncbi:unnamed protein product [Haemonchus placei]|uniref:Transposase n=1 Tax=Haemonchus placei TaxID=6290 RepID=A0A0N4X0Y8_HAEPC|nr:unnamed protein product [Haemonchus placei]
MDFASSFRATGQNAFAAHQSPQVIGKRNLPFQSFRKKLGVFILVPHSEIIS